MNKVLCIYHANCADGLGAAWAVHRALGNGVEFVAAGYGDDPFKTMYKGDKNAVLPSDRYKYKFKDRDVLIVDFSYPLSTLRAMSAEARSVLVIDHHKTAQEDLSELHEPMDLGKRTPASYVDFLANCGRTYTVGQPEHGEQRVLPVGGNLTAIFDMNRSGAGLTWDYLHDTNSRPKIIDLIEDRDLWKFQFGDETRAFHAVLTSYDITDLPAMFKFLGGWANVVNEWSLGPGIINENRHWRNLLEEGYAILRARRQLVTSLVRASRRTMLIAGHVVPVANVPPQLASDAGELMCQEMLDDPFYSFAPNFAESFEKSVPNDDKNPSLFSATYHDASDGRRHFSLRSPEGGADVGQIAKQMAEMFTRRSYIISRSGEYPVYTGGGHVHAAGFDAPLGWEGENDLSI